MYSAAVQNTDNLQPDRHEAGMVCPMLSSSMLTIPSFYMYSGDTLPHWEGVRNSPDYQQKYSNLPLDEIVQQIGKFTIGERVDLVWLGVGSSQVERALTGKIYLSGLLNSVTVHDELAKQVMPEVDKFRNELGDEIAINALTGEFHSLPLRINSSNHLPTVVGIVGLTLTNVPELDVLLHRISGQLRTGDLLLADFLYAKKDIDRETLKPEILRTNFSESEMNWFRTAYAQFCNDLKIPVTPDEVQVSFDVTFFSQGYSIDISGKVPALEQGHLILRLPRFHEAIVDNLYQQAGFEMVAHLSGPSRARVRIARKI